MATTSKTAKKTTKAKRTPAASKTPAGPKASTGKKTSTTRTTAKATPAMERRADTDRRKTSDRREKSEPVAHERRTIERRAKVNRRRQIDPTTCERDYTSDEIEFMNAMEEYKRQNGRMFPTCSEVLEVVKKLGYEKRPAGALLEASLGDLSAQQASQQTAV